MTNPHLTMHKVSYNLSQDVLRNTNMVKIKKQQSDIDAWKHRWKRCFQWCETLDKASQRDSETLAKIGLTAEKATATSTARLYQITRKGLTEKEDKSLAVNSHLFFETKTNFELNPSGKRQAELLKDENSMGLVWHHTQHMHIFQEENSKAF